MKVIAMPAKDDMSSLLRVTWPAQELIIGGADVEIVDEPWMIRERDREVVEIEAPPCDVLVLCRPQHENIAQSIPLLQAAGIAVVVDYDDDLSAIHPQNHAVAAFDPDRNPRSNWKWAHACAEAADLVTVSTPALLDVYAAHGRGLVLPNRLPSWRVPERPDYEGPVRLGWPGFIGTHPTDLLEMDGAAGKVLRRIGEPFHVIGGGKGLTVAQRARDNAIIERQVGWRVRGGGFVDKTEWPQALTALDVGVVPAARSRFNAAKSALKSMELAAAGAAVIASPIPDNRRAAADGLCVIAEDRHDWGRLLRRFVGDDQARLEQAERGRAGVAAHLLDRHVGDWWDAWCLAKTNHDRNPTAASYLATVDEQKAGAR